MATAGLRVLLDAKRGDIGPTAAGYAAACLAPRRARLAAAASARTVCAMALLPGPKKMRRNLDQLDEGRSESSDNTYRTEPSEPASVDPRVPYTLRCRGGDTTTNPAP